MRFSAWYPADAIDGTAPDEPGVFQVRAPGLLNYPRGKSAMVHYAAAERLRPAISAWAAQHGGEGYLYRHTLELGGRTPQAALERVLGRFVDRFGEPPRSGPEAV